LQFNTAAAKKDHGKKEKILDDIIAALTIHAITEEEIFYPAVKNARAQQGQEEVREVYEEHKQMRTLLSGLTDLTPEDESYDAKAQVLREDVAHHVKPEEGAMFPDAAKLLSKERLETIGVELGERRAQLAAKAKCHPKTAWGAAR
jgi:iron-sulfur cluster repair protein YtfE (RIC family)